MEISFQHNVDDLSVDMWKKRTNEKEIILKNFVFWKRDHIALMDPDTKCKGRNYPDVEVDKGQVFPEVEAAIIESLFKNPQSVIYRL